MAADVDLGMGPSRVPRHVKRMREILRISEALVFCMFCIIHSVRRSMTQKAPLNPRWELAVCDLLSKKAPKREKHVCT